MKGEVEKLYAYPGGPLIWSKDSGIPCPFAFLDWNPAEHGFWPAEAVKPPQRMNAAQRDPFQPWIGR